MSGGDGENGISDEIANSVQKLSEKFFLQDRAKQLLEIYFEIILIEKNGKAKIETSEVEHFFQRIGTVIEDGHLFPDFVPKNPFVKHWIDIGKRLRKLREDKSAEVPRISSADLLHIYGIFNHVVFSTPPYSAADLRRKQLTDLLGRDISFLSPSLVRILLDKD
jgi:hypothetical protein